MRKLTREDSRNSNLILKESIGNTENGCEYLINNSNILKIKTKTSSYSSLKDLFKVFKFFFKVKKYFLIILIR